ncbi:flavin reductase family protein [Klugiella sp. YN-L-19]|uniref:Flavin reductase family protein n=2 Tax=Ruicaihuangia caeni TaxID=3042517 RepID=A0AAW6T4F3_9MICO|nr:flavin reductase family protein [Klugiella sp. YN-L-19]
MTDIDLSELEAGAAYRLMTGVIVPRPIAWVTTTAVSGAVNLAPFSCYTMVSYAPVLVGISIGRRAEGRKDTAVNILRDGEFVLNVAHESEAALVHRSSAQVPADISEVELLGLETCPSVTTRTPRLASAPIALECRLEQVLTFDGSPSEFFIGRVALAHIDTALYRDGKIETRELKPLARIAGPNYSKVETVLEYTAEHQRW